MRLALRIGHQRSARSLAQELRKRYSFVHEEFIEPETPAITTKGAENLSEPSQGQFQPEEFIDVDVVVVVGGDGFMLSQLRRAMNLPQSLRHFGLNVGSSGFLLNSAHPDNLVERISAAKSIQMPVLEAKATFTQGHSVIHHAINEVTLFRNSPQTAHLRISVDGIPRLARLVADGVIVSTPAGSTGYNSSLHGPILPLESSILALTPISPFRPRRWRGALLPQAVNLSVQVCRSKKRPVTLTVDNQWVGEVEQVDIGILQNRHVNLLFDPNAHLQDRMIKEQFAT